MTVFDIRFCDPGYTIETYQVETTLSGGPTTPTIGWFSRSDWQRGLDIVVIDPAQSLPDLNG